MPEPMSDPKVIYETDTLQKDGTRGKQFWKGEVIKTDDGEFAHRTDSWSLKKNGDESKHRISKPTFTEAKNVGQSNERGPLEQAISEIDSKADKKKDKRYWPVGEEKPDFRVMPMSAKKYGVIEAGEFRSKRGPEMIDFPVFCQPKLDGCLHGATEIYTDEGLLMIEDIVDEEKEVEALSYNQKTGELEYKPVVDWHDNGLAPQSEWTEVQTERSPRHLRCTNDHEIKTKEGWKRADEIEKDDKVLVNLEGDYWLGLMTGTLLGDSALSIDKRGHGRASRMYFQHVSEELAEFKADVLNLDGKWSDKKTGYGSESVRFVSSALTESILPTKRFYHVGNTEKCGQRKRIPYHSGRASRGLKDLLTPEGLALWIADDGSLRMNNGNEYAPVLSISTHNHSEAQLDEFIKYFENKWQCSPTKIKDKRVDDSGGVSGMFLNFDTKDTLYILNQLRDKQVRGAEYKFYFPTEGYVTPAKDYEWADVKTRDARSSPETRKYDLEVEGNHNYVANSVVAHNCRMMLGPGEAWTRKLKPFIDEVQELFVGAFDLPGAFSLPDVRLDGEVMLPPEEHSFQETVSAVKRYQKDLTPKLELQVFDVYDTSRPELDFETRYSMARDLVSRAQEKADGKIELVPTQLAQNHEEVLQLHGEYVEQGREGTMVRSASGTYKDATTRSGDLLKLKGFTDEEFEITGVREGQGKFAGMAIMICETDDGQTFEVTPKANEAEKRRMFEEQDEIVGQPLTVRFQNYSDDGLPRFPVGISIRDYE